MQECLKKQKRSIKEGYCHVCEVGHPAIPHPALRPFIFVSWLLHLQHSWKKKSRYNFLYSTMIDFGGRRTMENAKFAINSCGWSRRGGWRCLFVSYMRCTHKVRTAFGDSYSRLFGGISPCRGDGDSTAMLCLDDICVLGGDGLGTCR